MFKTGLRISDTLNLKQDCLIKIKNDYYLEVDISKTYINGHRIPIDNELASIVANMINKSFEDCSAEYNTKKYIFLSSSNRRIGSTMTSKTVSDTLNKLAIRCNIVDESNNIFRFKNHAFRHTYGVKMINSGVDIFTVQSLLAHAFPEMTMRYAKLLDDTKRKAFDDAMNQGVFSFDSSSELKESELEISSDILDMLWKNHKLNALDTPYGTCMQRLKGKCKFAKQPPCLTCNSGKPCKDLCIGAYEGDVSKYSILINSTKSLIENAKYYKRDESIRENQELLKLYEDIYLKISSGNIVYSRLDRLIRSNGNE